MKILLIAYSLEQDLIRDLNRVYCGEFGPPVRPFPRPWVTTARRPLGQSGGGPGAVAPGRVSLDTTVDLCVGHDFGKRGL